MDLPRLLRHAEHTGIYHLPPGGQQSLAAASASADLLYVHSDLAENPSLDAALSRLAECLQFPDWFGHNLDALHDCLTDLSWHDATGWVLLISGIDALRAADEAGYEALSEVLSGAAEYWREQEIPFWVFLDLRADGLADLPTIG